MPKRVDHEERRRQIAQALWRIAAARGLDGASLRDVAAEAGISLGQLQHYFTSKDDMIVFALGHIEQLAQRRIRARIEALPGAPTPRVVLRETLAEMLPLDEASRTGYLVQVSYFIRAVNDERLRAHAQEGIADLRAFFADQLKAAIAQGEVSADRDPDREAALLIALTDGLSAAVLMEYDSAQGALALVDLHLARLFSGPA
ncbi:TetR family transcriptional regulator C-terminal domain-containing protein [Streptomyces sp. NBS 14/10]|uniref:TetR/AcrR family transcriptional regulator n=1 Tax=Streptomyces sp. NBS 14/10 TaxID=1945643 RepID=UPI000B7F0FFD|nr:TetR family transcriptional regulator C-terminal domain-containing protein [Streptomyces sp. NBS 14/10]KAK1179303.1 TetR family transcriptional regulator C-terminal domain-containing protein [Streptomyces sp. NBS 14/10]NUS82324.1 TetR family transcriptional regulator [Streptomyces sp.]